MSASRLLTGFLAGFVAVLVFHQGMLLLLNLTGVVGSAPWSMAPTAPLGVPSVLSAAFWGGVWGVVFALVEPRLPRGAGYWVVALLFGGIALTLVFALVVAPIKGMGVPTDPAMLLVGFLVNGAWGIGAALLLRLVARRRHAVA